VTPVESTRPVGVGFVGGGSVLPAYLQALDRLVPRGLAAEGRIAVRRHNAWPELQRRRPGVQLVETAREVIEDDHVDLVVILTPPQTHAELARAALAAGRHVLVEKPLAVGPEAASALFDEARAAGLVLLAAPFVHLSPTFRRLWTLVRDGAIGSIHAARAHYGNPGSTWAAWYHEDPAATLGDVGIYNLKSLAALLGPVVEVRAACATALGRRRIGDSEIDAKDPDTWQLVLRHVSGALSSVLASHATWRYRRPAIELYGTEGTANLLGDDWDPHGIELYRESTGSWELIDPSDATWLWTDGLREAVTAIRSGAEPLGDPTLDVHVLEVIEAAMRAAAEDQPVDVKGRFSPIEALRFDPQAGTHVHDRTRPADEQ